MKLSLQSVPLGLSIFVLLTTSLFTLSVSWSYTMYAVSSVEDVGDEAYETLQTLATDSVISLNEMFLFTVVHTTSTYFESIFSSAEKCADRSREFVVDTLLPQLQDEGAHVPFDAQSNSGAIVPQFARELGYGDKSHIFFSAVNGQFVGVYRAPYTLVEGSERKDMFEIVATNEIFQGNRVSDVCPLSYDKKCNATHTYLANVTINGESILEPYGKVRALTPVELIALPMIDIVKALGSDLAWGPLITVDYIISISVFAPIYSSTGTALGLVYVGVDVRQMSQFLSETELAPHQRILATMPDGCVIAASHGPSNIYEKVISPATGLETFAARLLYANQSTDPVILGISNVIETSYNGSWLQNFQKPVVFDVSGEKHFLLISSILKHSGLKVVVCTTIPFNLTLGPIKQKGDGILSEREQNRKDVDKRFERQAYLIALGLFVFLVLIIVFAWSTTKFYVQSLVYLEQNMAEVAVMNFEAIVRDPPQSRIKEVASMQASFLTMVDNLEELRRFMPQSVLVGTAYTNVVPPS
eukprot:PhM_4_TR2103/c1_g1_i2/m.41655